MTNIAGASWRWLKIAISDSYSCPLASILFCYFVVFHRTKWRSSKIALIAICSPFLCLGAVIFIISNFGTRIATKATTSATAKTNELVVLASNLGINIICWFPSILQFHRSNTIWSISETLSIRVVRLVPCCIIFTYHERQVTLKITLIHLSSEHIWGINCSLYHVHSTYFSAPIQLCVMFLNIMLFSGLSFYPIPSRITFNTRHWYNHSLWRQQKNCAVSFQPRVLERIICPKRK